MSLVLDSCDHSSGVAPTQCEPCPGAEKTSSVASQSNPAGCLVAPEVATWRCGRILVRDGKLVSIRRRHWNLGASLAQVIWQAGWGRSEDDTCVIDYHSPRSMPAFITFDYMRAGRTAGYRSFCQAIRTLEAIASLKNTHAIVAHITNPAITDRLLIRWGWEQHCLHWKGRHWIKRF